VTSSPDPVTSLCQGPPVYYFCNQSDKINHFRLTIYIHCISGFKILYDFIIFQTFLLCIPDYNTNLEKVTPEATTSGSVGNKDNGEPYFLNCQIIVNKVPELHKIEQKSVISLQNMPCGKVSIKLICPK